MRYCLFYLNDINFLFFKYISDKADGDANKDLVKNISIGKKLFIKKITLKIN